MSHQGKLMEMLTGYAAAHQHPFNIFVHMIGIPTIMVGVLIPLSWVGWDLGGFNINLAHVAMLGFFLFYLTLDKPFALAFLVIAFLLVQLATWAGQAPVRTSGAIASCSPAVLDAHQRILRDHHMISSTPDSGSMTGGCSRTWPG